MHIKTKTLQINQSVQKIHQIYNAIYEGKVEMKKTTMEALQKLLGNLKRQIM
jgi:hypothetical protein